MNKNKRTFKRNPRVLGTSVLVQLIPPEQVSAGGIIMAAGSEQGRLEMATTEAYIVKTGALAFSDWQGEEDPPKVNDKVLMAKYAGREVPNLDEEGHIYRLIAECDVGAVFEGEEYVGE